MPQPLRQTPIQLPAEQPTTWFDLALYALPAFLLLAHGVVALAGRPEVIFDEGDDLPPKRRRPLGPANLLTVPEAVGELGMRKEDGRRWLHERGLVVYPLGKGRGRGRVIAGALATAVQHGVAKAPPRRSAPAVIPLPLADDF